MYACSGNTIPAGIRGVSFYLSFYAAGKRRKNMAFVIELLLIGVGLSMDAFAVAVCKGPVSYTHLTLPTKLEV